MNAGGRKEELIKRWQTEVDLEKRDELIDEMIASKLFPDNAWYHDKWFLSHTQAVEDATGLFPDIEDPLFTEKLFHKREFGELKQRSMSEMILEAETEEKKRDERRARGEKVEDLSLDFEISPVQRFVSRFLSPSTPYNSILLYHGVGVGKTCAAITTAEVFLEKNPTRTVIILAPPNIQPNFRREIFDINKVKWGNGETIPNSANGCTGSLYLQLANCLMKRESDSSIVKYRIDRVIDKRYKIMGYLEFANYIESLFKRIPAYIKGNQRTQRENAIIRDFFSGKLIIVDEAHNLRESFEAAPGAKKGEKSKVRDGDEIADPVAGEDGVDDEDADASPEEKKAHEEGKRSAAKLMEVLDKSEGAKLMLLTATPMYNDPSDLIFLLNLLLRNDKRTLLSMLPPGVAGSLFNKDKSLTSEARKLIANASSAYISFMRGENPLNFPVRLFPKNIPNYKRWATLDVNGAELRDETETGRLLKLPFVACQMQGPSLVTNIEAIQSVKKVTANYNSEIFFAQAANVTFPIKSKNVGDRIGNKGFSKTFSVVDPKAGAGNVQYSAEIDSSWMRLENLSNYSAKMEFIVRRLQTCDGVAFIYSRFISAGGLTLAMALEVNGYKATGARARNILAEKDFVGQCALCPQKANNHTNKDHPFTQAQYVFLSGDSGLSGNNRDSIEVATVATGENSNTRGQRVKVIIGSTVAGEGIDLKFIREIYVLDTWFHLNKLEQILGRGIRNKSHIALPKEKRNVTVYLLTNQFPADSTFANRETTDMYFYRYALNKAYRMGEINRFIKQNALDCNINYEAVVITDLKQKRIQIDSQGGKPEEVDLNDQPYTSICDWQSTCRIDCADPVRIDLKATDTLTYDDYGSKYRNSLLRQRLREIFARQPFYTFADLQALFSDIPKIALVNLLSEIVNNRNFLFGSPDHQGFITFRNDFYLFQPIRIKDLAIPMAIRAAEYPIKRDDYGPQKLEVEKVEAGKTTVSEVDDAKLLDLWNKMITWSKSLSVPGGKGKMPEGLMSMIEKRYSYSADKRRRVTEELEMITYFYNSIKSRPDLLKIFSTVALCFLWDEYLKNDEQIALYRLLRDVTAPNDLMTSVWNEQQVGSDRYKGFRVVNRDTAKLNYYTFEPGEFREEKIEGMIKLYDKGNSLFGLRANSQNCGYLYGTLNVKRGDFVFKTNTPVEAIDDDAYAENPDLESKGKKGRECAASSASQYHKDKLYELGETAETSFGHNFGLEEDIIERGPRKIAKTNANMICALTDLALRTMDALDSRKPKGKRWFFRPVATVKTGHPSIVALKIE